MTRALALAAGMLVLAASGCGGDKESAGETTTVVTTVTGPGTETEAETGTITTSGKYDYPPVVVNNFMKSCTNGMQNRRAYCACTLDELSNSISVQDFARIGLAGGKLPPRVRRVIQDAAVECANEIQG